jgi:cytochrome P450 family 135
MPTPAIPPGPRLPRPVQTLAWVKRPGPFMERCRARYGETFTIRVASEGTWVLMTDPAAVRQVFTGDPRLLHAGEANVVLRPILGSHSVLLLDDAPHLAQRRLLLPPFHGERMKRYGELMTGIAEREVASWPTGEPLALLPRMQALTMEIILRAVFGIREADRLDRLRALLTRMMEVSTRPSRFLAIATMGPDRVERLGLLRPQIAPVDELLIDEIRRRRADPAVAEREDILSLLVQATHEDGSPMGDRELRDELITLLLAGHETTATSLSWALERLLRHPAAWARLQDEAAGDDDAYVDATVKETLRLRPVLPLVARKLVEPMEIGGHLLPAGVTVAPCIYLMHRRADLYPDPYAFRPERFLEQPAGTYTWIPFGGGIRRCLGASFALFEMATVLRVIARSAALAPAQPAPERVRRRAIMLTPSRGAAVVRSPRPEPARDPVAV